MGGSGTLETTIGGLVSALLVGFERSDSSRVDIVVAAVCCAVDEGCAIALGHEGHDVEGGEGVD